MKIKMKQLRAGKGWTQQQAAQHMDLSIGAIQSIEIGRALPSLRTALRMKKVFGLSCIDEMIDEDM